VAGRLNCLDGDPELFKKASAERPIRELVTQSRMRPDASTGADRLTILGNGRRQAFGPVQSLAGQAQDLGAATIEDLVLGLNPSP
jgi:hypothetical protein